MPLPAVRTRRPIGAGHELQDRCIHYGFPDLFAAYMSVYRIVQSPQAVAIQMEKIHDTRIIPLDGRPHWPRRCAAISATRAATGKATRSWWRPRTSTRREIRWAAIRAVGREPAPDRTLPPHCRRHHQYTFTVDNPTMWTRPWTAVINWKRSRGELSIRLPRGQLQPARHAVGGPGGGGRGQAIAPGCRWPRHPHRSVPRSRRFPRRGRHG